MRSKISNELLLQVIQAWDPDGAGDLYVDGCGELRCGEGSWYVRWPNGDMYISHRSIAEASKLVEFLLKDRPDLNPDSKVSWDKDVLSHSRKEWGIAWASDPFSELGAPIPSDIVRRLKSYEYLREWKERQEGNMKIETPSVAGAMTFRPNGPKAISDFTGGEPKQTLYISTEHPLSILNGSKIRLSKPVPFDMKPGEILSLINCEGVWWETSRVTTIDPDDVTLSIEGQTIEGMEIHDDVLGVPATYDRICPHCNGSKEVVGWHGKESCNVC